MTLWELTDPVTHLRGVGRTTASDLARLGITTVRDLLLFAPRDYEDRRTTADFAEAVRALGAVPGEPLSRGRAKAASGGEAAATANTEASVVGHEYIGGRGGKRTLKVLLSDRGGNRASLVCFGRNFLANKLPPGKSIRIFGTFSHKYGELQSSSFEFEPLEARSGSFDRILPMYPLAGSLTQGGLRKVITTALSHYGDHVVDTLPSSLRESSTASLLRSLHFPETVECGELSRQALAFEEFLLLQVRIVRDMLARREESRGDLSLPRGKRDTLVRALPFTLTTDQLNAIEEIHSDLEKSRPMHRLLQGDVGSGKTLVALVAALSCIEAGYQVALMAPTELLARQHADNAARFLDPVGVRTAFLTGSLPRTRRQPLLGALEAGEIDLVVGTHALFTPDVRFRALKLAVIDEQQRFGVMQRAALEAKGEGTDLLVTTATPIPRTLALGIFGDLDVSTIRSMPPGRKPVRTHLARTGNERKVYDRVASELAAGHQAYFVYPLIEEGVNSAVKNSTDMFEKLDREIFPDARVGLVHSRIPEEQKENTMAAFSRGELDILVATSVVEVGVDVANATCMVIEHAERFGLAALHQLRGRVGRSDKQSYCFLIYSDELTDAGKERMRVMHATSDGFEIAEEDLKIRGPGNVAGTRQSGYVKLLIADLARDFDLLTAARRAAEEIVGEDSGLIEAQHRGLRSALAAFSQLLSER